MFVLHVLRGGRISGMLAAMDGATVSIGFTDSFNQEITGGRRFVALAAPIFGRWRLFGAYLLTLVVAGVSGGSVAPAADGVPDVEQ